MCTAIIEVPESPDTSVRLLAVRDEDPGRAWDAPGHWWSELPGVIGVRDRVAGGAWLAAAPASGRIALILNRAEASASGLPEGPNQVTSRGLIVLEEVAGMALADPPRTANFNLVSIQGARASVTSWDGSAVRRVDLAPGMHMIAHHDVDDAARTPRIEKWLPEFQALAGLPANMWREQWVSLLEKSARLSADDDRAIIRDNRTHGYETLSLLFCLAESGTEATPIAGGLQIDTAVFSEPGHWQPPVFETISV